MNKNEFYNAVVDAINGSASVAKGYLKEINSIRVQKANYTFTEGYVENVLDPAENVAVNNILKAKNDFEVALDKIGNEYLCSLGEVAALNPAEITDDARLFSIGVTLTKDDIKGILDRNPNNRTMVQLCKKYSIEHGIMFPAEYLTVDEVYAKAVDMIEKAKLSIDWGNYKDVFSDHYNYVLTWGAAE